MTDDVTFERIFAVDEREINGTILGDRIRLVAESSRPDDRVHLYRESKMERGEALSWDWKVDPDAGLSMSEAQAIELHDALGEWLANSAAESHADTKRKLRTCIAALRHIERATKVADTSSNDFIQWLDACVHSALDAIGDDRGAWERELAEDEP